RKTPMCCSDKLLSWTVLSLLLTEPFRRMISKKICETINDRMNKIVRNATTLSCRRKISFRSTLWLDLFSVYWIGRYSPVIVVM
ncbi:hypothetical protein PFISCL1PPCAC_11919, partial [Pristionchus fissidentatus]